jgi:hypothetical protein
MLVKNKAIQELFDPTYGRLNATFGVEIPFTSALTQTTIPLGYVDAPTEDFADGETQIWKITHNGVDSHPIHFHLMNVQLINRVGWDNFISPPEPNELGWKETLKMSPLEDVFIAVHAKKPPLPGFGLPTSGRLLDPSQPLGAMTGFTQIDPTTGLPATMVNTWQNFGWEYVWHCHILGHEENDFMRPIIFNPMDVLPDKPATPTASLDANGQIKVSWVDATPASFVDPSSGKLVVPSLDDPKSEIGFRVERAPIVNKVVGAYIPIGTVAAVPNGDGSKLEVNTLANATSLVDDAPVADYAYRLYAVNSMGDSVASDTVVFVSGPPAAPSNLRATAHTASSVTLAWADNSISESGFLLDWTSGTTTLAVDSTTGVASGLAANTAYTFTVTALATAPTASSAPSNTVTETTAPVAVSTLAGSTVLQGTTANVTLNWSNTNPNLGTLSSVVVSGTVDGVAIAPITQAAVANGTVTLTGLGLGKVYALTVTVNGVGGAAASSVSGSTATASLLPATGLSVELVTGPVGASTFALNWVDASLGESGYQAQVCYGSTTQCTTATTLISPLVTYPGTTATVNRWYPVAAGNLAYTAPTGDTGAASALVTGLAVQTATPRYYFRVVPLNVAVTGPASNISAAVNLTATPTAPTAVSAVSNSVGTALVSWTDTANNNATFNLQQRATGGIASITLGTAGTRYTVAPSVVISAPAAGGVQATAHAVATPVVGTTGGVVTIVIDNPGTGYTARPTVTVSGGTRNAGGTAASGTGTATANLGLGTNVWTTAYTAIAAAAVPVGNSTSVTATGLSSGTAYQFQVQPVGISGVNGTFVNTGTGVIKAQ